MDYFQMHKMNNDEWYSPPFYSHARMCLKVDANGFGSEKGTHMSVFVCLMRREFDDHLKWPFSGEVTIQLNSDLHFQKLSCTRTVLYHTSMCVIVNHSKREMQVWARPST